MSEEQEILDYEAHNARTALKLNKAEHEIERLQARVAALEGKQHRIEQWCKAYPRTVFIEPTEEQWEWANQVLDADPGCPSLTAISGSNMRHVVEGIQALAATEQEGEI